MGIFTGACSRINAETQGRVVFFEELWYDGRRKIVLHKVQGNEVVYG